jgi:ribosomal protein L37AE/L43A
MNSEAIIGSITADFPDFRFERAERARWSPVEKIVFYDDSPVYLLHELGHALLGHANFREDVELVKMERDAWTEAAQMAARYGVVLSEDEVEAAMDDYREWLHRRSLCPTCQMTGLQSAENLTYACINCGGRWRANDARSCGLRRRKV